MVIEDDTENSTGINYTRKAEYCVSVRIIYYFFSGLKFFIEACQMPIVTENNKVESNTSNT